MNRRARTKAALALTSVLALLLAACGSDGDVDEPEDTAEEEVEEEPEEEPEAGAEPETDDDYEVPEEFRQMVLVGSSEGGGGHTWWIAASQLFNEYLGMETSVRPGGTRENALLMETGEIQASTVSPVDLVEATENADALGDTTIRTLWNKFNVAYAALVPEDSDAEFFSDLEGSRIAIGIAGGGESNLFLQALECAGLDESSYQLEFTGKGEAVSSYNDGVIDAWAAQGPNPMPQFLEAFEGRGAKLVQLDEEIVDCLSATGQYLADEIPAGTYPGQDQPVATVNQWFYAAIHEDVPEELAFHMARVLDEHFDELLAAYGGATTSTAENTASAIGFELHPGVERYLQEAGHLN